MNSAAGKLPPKFLLMISLQTPQISTYENINTNNNKYTNKVTHIDMNSFTCNGPSSDLEFVRTVGTGGPVKFFLTV